MKKRIQKINNMVNENIRLIVHHFPLVYRICLFIVREYGKLYFSRIDKENGYTNRIKRLKNSKRGKRCFIIGNGPSLSVEDLDKLKSEDCFGSNRLYKIFKSTDWRPTYYVVIDWRGLNNEEINAIDVKTLFLGDYFFRKHKITRKDCYVFYGNRLLDTRYESFRYSDDISKEVFLGATVTYACIQIATYLGYKDIYLLGMDHNYAYVRNEKGGVVRNESVNQTHFFKDEDLSKSYGDMTGMTNAYIKAKEYTESHGIRIFNATRGGKLEVFDRVDFDSLVK